MSLITCESPALALTHAALTCAVDANDSQTLMAGCPFSNSDRNPSVHYWFSQLASSL
jgi:hypothetical protein